MKRGDLVAVAISGDYGKPRPAPIIQADAFGELGSFTMLRLTSELHDWPGFRVTVEPTEANGLRATSQIMIDKAAAVPREKIGGAFGHLDAATVPTVNRALVVFLGLEAPAVSKSLTRPGRDAGWPTARLIPSQHTRRCGKD